MGIFLKDLKPTGWMGFHVKVVFYVGWINIYRSFVSLWKKNQSVHRVVATS